MLALLRQSGTARPVSRPAFSLIQCGKGVYQPPRLPLRTLIQSRLGDERTRERFVQNQIHRRVRTAYRKSMGFDRPHLVPLEAVAPAGAPDPALADRERIIDLERAVAGLTGPEQQHLREYLGLVTAGSGPDEAARTLSVRHGGSFSAWKKRLERADAR